MQLILMPINYKEYHKKWSLKLLLLITFSMVMLGDNHTYKMVSIAAAGFYGGLRILFYLLDKRKRLNMKSKQHKMNFSDLKSSKRVDFIESLDDSGIKESIKEIKKAQGAEAALQALAHIASDEMDNSIKKVTQND